jgi:osmotically-inducible protein OsmY
MDQHRIDELSTEPPEYLSGHIHQSLIEDARVGEQGISVTVTPGNVFLTGVVTTAERREAITVVARELAPEHRIHNQVSVAAFQEPTEAEALS